MSDEMDLPRALPGVMGDRSGDQEVDPGYHHIYQGETKVGEIFYPFDADVEHWALYPTYIYPSSRNPIVTMTFHYIGDPRDNASGVPANLTAFLAGVPTNAVRMALTIARE